MPERQRNTFMPVEDFFFHLASFSTFSSTQPNPPQPRSTYFEIKALLAFSVWRVVNEVGAKWGVGRKICWKNRQENCYYYLSLALYRLVVLLPQWVLYVWVNVEKSTLQLRSSVSAFHGWRTFYVCSAWNWIAFTLLEARWKESAQKTLLCTFFIRLYFFLRSVIYVNESISFPTPTHSITSTHIFRMAFYMSFHNFYVRHASKRWDQIGENRRRDIIARGKGESIIALHDAWTLETVPFLLVFLTRCQRHTRDEWFFGVAWYFHVFFRCCYVGVFRKWCIIILKNCSMTC